MPRPGQRGADNGASTAATTAGRADGLFYKIVWQPAESGRPGPRPPSELEAARTEKRRQWVVLADRGELGLALAPALEASGDAVKVMDPDEWRAEIQSSGSSLGRSLGVDGESEDLHEEAACEANLGIVYLGALDEEVQGEPDFNRVDLEFLKHAARAKEGKIWLVTKGAMNVRGLEDVTSPGQASLWGLAGPLPENILPIGGGCSISILQETPRTP